MAFISGFNLPCSNGFGFKGVRRHSEAVACQTLIYIQAIKSLEGGSEPYLSSVWASRTISAESLVGVVTVGSPPEAFRNRLSRAAHPNGPSGRSCFRSLIEKFVSGSGVPCEDLFSEVKHVFDSIIDLSKISTPGFRARMLVWATTGSPFVDIDPPENQGLSILFTARFTLLNLCSTDNFCR